MTGAVPAGHRSGFVGLVGRPNVGKSTMLNALLGEKIAIVSQRPQTTRRRILGVLTRPEAQVIFLDTPGLHEPEHALGRYMLEVVKSAMDEADVLVVLVDARSGLTDEDERVFGRVRQVLSAPSREGAGPRCALLAVNKVDAVSKPRILPILERAAATRLFAEYVPVSAKTGEQLDVLLTEIIARLPAGPRWYEPEQRTDQTTQERVSELIREQILEATYQEVPQSVGVLMEQIEERPKVIAVRATLLVERPGQKAILIGREGSTLKAIGQRARQQLERLLGRKVFLELWVKVAPHWRKDERILKELGYGGA